MVDFALRRALSGDRDDGTRLPTLGFAGSFARAAFRLGDPVFDLAAPRAERHADWPERCRADLARPGRRASRGGHRLSRRVGGAGSVSVAPLVIDREGRDVRRIDVTFKERGLEADARVLRLAGARPSSLQASTSVGRPGLPVRSGHSPFRAERLHRLLGLDVGSAFHAQRPAAGAGRPAKSNNGAASHAGLRSPGASAQPPWGTGVPSASQQSVPIGTSRLVRSLPSNARLSCSRSPPLPSGAVTSNPYKPGPMRTGGRRELPPAAVSTSRRSSKPSAIRSLGSRSSSKPCSGWLGRGARTDAARTMRLAEPGTRLIGESSAISAASVPRKSSSPGPACCSARSSRSAGEVIDGRLHLRQQVAGQQHPPAPIGEPS